MSQGFSPVLIKCQGHTQLPIDTIQDFQGNLKELSKESYNKFKKQLLELGFSEPISVWDNDGKMFCLNGHQRLRTLKAMRDEGYAVPKELPVNLVEAKDLREAKKKVLALTSQYGQITSDGLYEFASEAGITFEELSSDFRLPEINFDKFEKEFGPDEKEGLTDDDAIPEKAPARVKLGDIWQLGEHRLMCGDSTNEDTDKLMDATQAALVFTDPPYNVNYEGSDGQKIKNDNMSADAFKSFCDSFCSQMFKHMKAGAPYYMWHADTEGHHFRSAVLKAGFHLASTLIWNKNSLIMGRSDYHWKHEPCLYGWKPGAAHPWYSDRKQTSVFDHEKGSGKDNKMHPTSKPVSLCMYFINNSSRAGDLILDLFGGSGSTIIAAEKLSRKCFAMELDPKYCDVILKRWEDFTGLKAVKIEKEKPILRKASKQKASDGKTQVRAR